MVLLVRAAIHPDQRVLEEDLAADGARIEEGPPRPDGSRPARARAAHGAISVGYEALVAVDGVGGFGDRPRTRALIPAVASWVRERIDYVPGSSDALTAADETLLRRQGVCRDMAHLAVALLRALEVPARLVAGYAVGLEPPDFHALLEAHDGERWRLVDVTGLAPVETVVRIAAGRDAADVAWATSSGGLRMEDVSVGARIAGVA